MSYLGKLSQTEARWLIEEAKLCGYKITEDDIRNSKWGLLWKEPCDCYEKYGRCMHSNGGNYHHMLEARIEGRWLVLMATDSSDDFSGDNYAWVQPEDGYWKEVDEAWLEPDEEYGDFRYNTRRDTILGIFDRDFIPVKELVSWLSQQDIELALTVADIVLWMAELGTDSFPRCKFVEHVVCFTKRYTRTPLARKAARMRLSARMWRS